MQPDIFISYRRKGAKTEAVLLYTLLKQKGYRVFLDFNSLHSGKFTEEIQETIAQCTDFVLLIHPAAFNRCSEPDDCFRLEVECALREKKNIIPILVNQRSFPTNIPEDLMEIKDFNSIQFLPLEYADVMVARLTTQYLTVQPAETSETLPELPVETEETQKTEEDPFDRWVNIREDQWKECPICGRNDVELCDEQGEFQEELEEMAQCLHCTAALSALTIPLILLLAWLCEIPAFGQWFMGYLSENHRSVMDLVNHELIDPSLKWVVGLLIPVLVTGIAIFTRNILRSYAEMIALREEDDYYKAACTCSHCKATFYAEIPTWNLAKEKAEKGEPVKAVYYVISALIYILLFGIADAVTFILHPVISFLAWPVLVAVFCSGGLIMVMILYERMKNQ